ncbi:MAG: HDIG domain-containing protein [Planctomycetota bacterium]|nr:MAG: HDIG domain-containing protein [Planctomycetota bacterium]
MRLLKKTSPRRSQLRKNITAERLSQLTRFINTDLFISALLWLLFVCLCVFVLSFQLAQHTRYLSLIPLAAIVVLISSGAAFYIYHYQRRIVKNHTRALALLGSLVLLLATTKLAVILNNHTMWATGTAVTAAIILTIAYNQRFAIGMSIFYCLLASFAATKMGDIRLFLTMAAGTFTCCLALREIRTRMKLLEVSTLAAVIVFTMAVALDFLTQNSKPLNVLRNAALHAGITLVVGVLIQGLLPLIEKVFRIATSMTLLDYSDANQPLLKRLAMEAPGTFSHSLLVGSIAEAAAEAINCNGLLCRVGAYYHDIGKINKANYFTENEMGAISQHKELSPAMSQLIIVGHVKDGVEMAKEYGIPTVLRQFIETHHGTTLIEYFFNEAKRKQDEKQSPPSEIEFRYTGPKPRTKEAAIAMLADSVEGAVRTLAEPTPTRIEAVVHNMAMKRLQDGQFDECDLSLRELSRIETSISKTLAAHHHARIPYPKPPDETEEPAPNESNLAKEPQNANLQKDQKTQSQKTPPQSEQTKQKT